MELIAFGMYVFFDIYSTLILIDIILSLLGIFGIHFRPVFFEMVLDPTYNFVKSNIPTQFWPFEFAPFIILLAIGFIHGIILVNYPQVTGFVQLFHSPF